MPDFLWPIFQNNPHLFHDVPALGAAAIEQWAKNHRGVRLFVVVVPQTFGRRLNFHPHLHILVSAGGLRESENRWKSGLEFDRQKLMELWASP
jgi:hypothetical protein